MSSKIYKLGSWNQSASLTASTPIFSTGTTLKVALQIAPTIAMEVIQWSVSFNGYAAAVPGVVELVEVDVAATGGTTSAIPCSTVATAISSSGTTSLVLNAPLQGTNASYQIGTFAAGGAAGGGEQMLVTAGGGGTTLTVVRGINDTTALSSIPVGTVVYGIAGSGIYSDIDPISAIPAADPTHAIMANVGTGLTGFNFSTVNSPTRVRQGDAPLLPPSAPYVLQSQLERGFELHPGRFGQIRVNFGTAVSMSCYMVLAV